MSSIKTNCVSKQSVKYQVLNREQCEEIVNATYRVLERTGCIIHNKVALQLMKEAGCFVEGERVRIPSFVLKKAISTTPSRLTLYDRMGNPAVYLEANKSYFGPGPTNTFIIDIETGKRRRVTKADVVNTAMVCEALPNTAWTSALAMVSDYDFPDLHEVHAMLPHTTKPILTWASNVDNLKDIVDMCAAAAGGIDKLTEKPLVMFIICPNDPLVHSDDAVSQILYLAEKRLPFQYVSGVTFGGSGPITIAGANVVGLADTLVGLIISQLKNPGAPFIAAKATDNLNMRTLAISHSKPEFVLAQAATADIFRYLDLPFAANLGESDSPVFDQQAAFDITMQLYTGALSGANLNNFVGFLETCNTGSLEAMVFGNEAVSYIRRMVEGIEVSAETLAEEVIHNVGPGGTFLAEEHTFKHFKESWQPSVLMSQPREEWEAAGKKDLGDRLNAKVKEIIAQGTQNPLSDKVMEQLDEILARAEARISHAGHHSTER
ncbi:trimethylamine methyltransferase family protein [Sporomusa sp.]|uniref:trimethylamine methyltransferase family protein n=1 Tax=Sporomusa sp. TaxID=2078658 RepID=UPI002C4A7689|nr:trimethylamine methyltransferase family protein [Sporomusa sp.]HWR42705.1 trimethylamine methyltransferase family protein [Sporomusa sp.]